MPYKIAFSYGFETSFLGLKNSSSYLYVIGFDIMTRINSYLFVE